MQTTRIRAGRTATAGIMKPVNDPLGKHQKYSVRAIELLTASWTRKRLWPRMTP